MTCSSSNWIPKLSSVESWLQLLTQTNVMIKILAILPLLERLLKTTLKKQRSQKKYEKLNPPLAHPLSTLELDIVPRAGVRNEYRKCY